MTSRYRGVVVNVVMLVALTSLMFMSVVEARPTREDLLERNRPSSAQSLSATSLFAKCVQACAGDVNSANVSVLQSCHHDCIMHPHMYDGITKTTTSSINRHNEDED